MRYFNDVRSFLFKALLFPRIANYFGFRRLLQLGMLISSVALIIVPSMNAIVNDVEPPHIRNSIPYTTTTTSDSPPLTVSMYGQLDETSKKTATCTVGEIYRSTPTLSSLLFSTPGELKFQGSAPAMSVKTFSPLKSRNVSISNLRATATKQAMPESSIAKNVPNTRQLHITPSPLTLSSFTNRVITSTLPLQASEPIEGSSPPWSPAASTLNRTHSAVISSVAIQRNTSSLPEQPAPIIGQCKLDVNSTKTLGSLALSQVPVKLWVVLILVWTVILLGG